MQPPPLSKSISGFSINLSGVNTVSAFAIPLHPRPRAVHLQLADVTGIFSIQHIWNISAPPCLVPYCKYCCELADVTVLNIFANQQLWNLSSSSYLVPVLQVTQLIAQVTCALPTFSCCPSSQPLQRCIQPKKYSWVRNDDARWQWNCVRLKFLLKICVHMICQTYLSPLE